ncbi:MAG: cytidylyltransferase domain-containing protein [Bacteroides uniformis]
MAAVNIPRKNIKPFMGKPIIAYSIEAALQSGLFDEVMVSTDDEEIAENSLRIRGQKVPLCAVLRPRMIMPARPM